MRENNQQFPKSVAFVDWSNVYIGARNFHSTRVDPLKLREVLARDRRLLHVHYFSAIDEENTGQAAFHAWLSRNGFLVHTRPLEERRRQVLCPSCGNEFDPICPECDQTIELPSHKSKMVDIDLAKHMLILANEYDDAILVSGDKDFLPAIEWLRNVRNRRVFIFTWKDAFSGLLIGNIDGVEYLDDYLDNIREVGR